LADAFFACGGFADESDVFGIILAFFVGGKRGDKGDGVGRGVVIRVEVGKWPFRCDEGVHLAGPGFTMSNYRETLVKMDRGVDLHNVEKD